MSATPSRDDVRHAKSGLASSLKDVKGITSLGIGKAKPTGHYVVRVTVMDQAAAEKVPHQFEGVPVEVSISGEFTAQ